MPLWNSNRKDYSEHTPLSTRDDDEEEPALPPYSDNPTNNGNGNSNFNNGGGGYDDGFGEGDFYHNGNNNISYTKLSNDKRNNLPHRHYRTGLICAYLKYTVTCCGCLGGTRTKRCFMCLFYLVLFATIMVCAAAVGYIIARDGSYQKTHAENTVADGGVVPTGTVDVTNTNSAATTTIINTSKQPQQLVPPPSNLHELCSDWITESGRQKCQSECTKAACCSLPASNSNSCWEDQAEECATYRAACMALELHSVDESSGGSGSNGSGGGGVIGPKTILYAPPSNLSVLCSPTALATPGGFDNCANVCRPSRCCFPDMFDCNLADDRYCADYEELCASVAESWRGSGHAVATTSSKSSSSTTSTSTSSSPTIANEVMKACNAANLNPPDDCLEACKPGACCYVSTSYQPIEQLFSEYYGIQNNPMESVSSCASSVGFCQQYGSCEHLNHMKDVAGWHSDEVNYVVDVSTPCKVEHIAQFGALQCSNVCQPAHCCFSEEYGCDDVELGHLDCEDYSDCHVLYPPKQVSTKELLKLAERIDDACSESSLKTIGGRSECHEVCKDHSCCFDQVGGCMDNPALNCLAYAGCEPYYNVPSGGGQVSTISNNDKNNVKNSNNNAGGSDEEIDMEIDGFVTELEQICSEDNLKTINGIYNCHNRCQSHLCCFVSDEDEGQYDCSLQRPTACSVYEPCKKLVQPIEGEEQVRPLQPSDIEQIVFDACFFGNDPLKITEEMVQKCHGVCAQRLCCFSDYLLQSSCRDTVGDDECQLYSLCEQLVTDDGVEVGNAIDLQQNEFDVDHLCSSKVSEDPDLYDACKGLCTERRSCCFDKPGYSCYDMEKEWCDEYKACEKTDLKFSGGVTTINGSGGISGGNNAPTSSSSLELIEKEVYDACYFGDDESRVTQQLVTKCLEVCQPRLCCFDSYKLETSCRASVGEDECTLFDLCEQMITDDGGVVKTFIELDLQEFEDDDSVDELPTLELIEKEVYDACYFGGDESRVTQQLVTKCLEVCQPRLCCFDSYKLETSCRASVGEDECTLFDLCEQMITDDGGVVKTFIELDLQEFEDDDSVDELPTLELIEKEVYDACYFGGDESRVTQQLVTKCLEVCQPRLCCFDSYKLETSCRASVGEDECELFGLCEQMITDDGGVVKTFIELDLQEFEDDDNVDELPTLELIEKEVYDACYFGDDESRVTQQLVTKCLEVCQPRLCCFDSYKLETSCRASVGEDECELFGLCEQMITDDGGVVKTFIELDLQEFEDDDNVNESSTLKLIDKSNINSASGPGSSVQYPSGNTGVASTLEDVCSDSSLKTLEGLQSCHNKCQTHLCCFTTDPKLAGQNCAGLIPAGCSAYEPCKKLVFPQGTEPAVSPTALLTQEETEKRVYDACYFGTDPTKVTEELVTNCHAVCAERLCCFSDYSLQSSCRATLGDDECDLFSLCEQLVTPNGVANDALDVEENEFGVDELCIDKVAENPNLFSACSEVCERRSCCFESDPNYSCYNLEKDWCDEYKACEFVEYNFYH